MKMTVTRGTTIVAMSLALSLALAGCTADTDTDAPASPSVTVDAATSAPAESPAATSEAAADPAGDQQAAMDAYIVALNEVAPSLLESFDGTYTSLAITGIGDNTVEYVYTYAIAADPAATTAGLEENIPMLQAYCDTAVFPEMESQGVTEDPRVIFTYLNPDGTLLWSHEFSRSAS